MQVVVEQVRCVQRKAGAEVVLKQVVVPALLGWKGDAHSGGISVLPQDIRTKATRAAPSMEFSDLLPD